MAKKKVAKKKVAKKKVAKKKVAKKKVAKKKAGMATKNRAAAARPANKAARGKVAAQPGSKEKTARTAKATSGATKAKSTSAPRRRKSGVVSNERMSAADRASVAEAERVRKHHDAQISRGLQLVQVWVPESDVQRIQDSAEALRINAGVPLPTDSVPPSCQVKDDQGEPDTSAEATPEPPPPAPEAEQPSPDLVARVEDASVDALGTTGVGLQTPRTDHDLNAEPTGAIGENGTGGSRETQTVTEEPGSEPKGLEPAEDPVVDEGLTEDDSGRLEDGSRGAPAEWTSTDGVDDAPRTADRTSGDVDTVEAASVGADGPRDGGHEDTSVGMGPPQEAEVETDGGQWPSAEVISLEDRSVAGGSETVNEPPPNSDGDSEQRTGPGESNADEATESASRGFMEQAINAVLLRKA